MERRFEILSRFASLAAALIGWVVLLGWLFEIPLFRTVLPGLQSMAFNTALAFILAGVVLAVVGLEPLPPWRAWLLHGAGFCLLALGLVVLAEYAFNWQSGLDQLFHRQTRWSVPGAPPGRFAPVTALNFTLLGSALVLGSRQRFPRLGQALAALVGFWGLLSVLGYAYAVQALYQVTAQVPMALHTAAGFCLLALGYLLARPDLGLVALVASDTAAGTTARRLLPVALLLPAVLGWLRVLGQEHGLYPSNLGTALLVLSMILLFSLAVLLSVRKLGVLEAARRQTEATLRHSEQQERQRADELSAAVRSREEAMAQLNALLANAPLGFAFFDREHRYVRLNEFLARQINGLPLEAHLGRPIREVLPVNAQAVDPLLDLVFNSGAPLENVVVTGQTPAAPGEHRDWLTGWFPVRTPDGQIPWVGAVVVEITAQRRTQAILPLQHRRLQLLQQAAAELLRAHEPAGILRGLHPRLAQDFGVDVFMLYGPGKEGQQFQLQACGGVGPEQAQQLEELRFGRALCVKPAEALEPIIATHLQSQEAPNRRFVRKLGFQSYLYYPLLVEDRLLGTLAFASRRREAYDSADLEFFQSIARTLAEALERQRLEAELQRHATQLESLVQERTARLRESVQELEGFSYSLTHDLRAPLRSMRSFAGFLQEECAERLPPEGRDYLHRIQESALRLDQLITDSLNYSRIVREELPLRPVHLGPLLRGMMGTYPNLQPPATSIAVEFEDVLVLGNESALTQCFSNLLSNAVKFVAPGVQPRIRIWAQEVQGGERGARNEAAKGAGGAPPAGFVRVWVEDNGIGIPAELKGKIFGMFQRLHNQQAYPGTGIGLTIVRKAVQRMGGQVGLESAPGQGSRFWVELKRATAQSAPTRSEPAGPEELPARPAHT